MTPRYLAMHILHVYRTYFPDTQGGLEKVIRQICLNTTRPGADNRILSLSPDPNLWFTFFHLQQDEARVSWHSDLRDSEPKSHQLAADTQSGELPRNFFRAIHIRVGLALRLA